MFKINFQLFLIFFVSYIFRYLVFNHSTNILSALTGSLIPIALYYLIITINSKSKSLALTSSAVLAINPLNLYYSNPSQWQYNLYPLVVTLISIIVFKTINHQTLSKLIKFILFLSIALLLTSTLIVGRNLQILYFSFLSPKFLIFQGDWQNIQQFTPYSGIVLFPTFIFLLIGIFFKSKIKLQKNYFLLLLLLAPIPAIIKKDSTSLGLMLTYTLPLIYFASLGITTLYNSLSKKIFKQGFVFTLSITYLVTLIYFLDLFTNHLIK